MGWRNSNNLRYRCCQLIRCETEKTGTVNANAWWMTRIEIRVLEGLCGFEYARTSRIDSFLNLSHDLTAQLFFKFLLITLHEVPFVNKSY